MLISINSVIGNINKDRNLRLKYDEMWSRAACETVKISRLESENVAMVEIKDNIHDDDILKVPVIIGHTIGNLHRPIKLEENRIYFPIQVDSEIDMFKKLFGSVNEHIQIKKIKIVFEPDEDMSIHEH